MKKVLIVEDDDAISGLYNIVFSKQDYSVEIAENGEVGLSKAKTFLPDIILLDIMMPKMNGIQVIQKLKSDPSMKNIPVIALSNLTEVNAEKAMLDEGAIKFIVKSQLLPDEIVKIVSNYLNSTA